MKYCLFLLIAGLLDAVFTNFGMALGLVDEGNPVMNFVIKHGWFYFYLIKILLPLVLIGLFYLRPLTGMLRNLLISASFLYGMILLLHIGWMVFFFQRT